MPLAIFLMGPTASGKTALAIDLVKKLPCEIISVDSAQVYRGMDIGTAKPDRHEQAVAPHRLIDIRDPTEHYSAAQFCEDALREMRGITSAGHIPLLVGGTMLYFRALQYGLSVLPKANPQVRARLARDARIKGLEALYSRLGMIDPEAARRIHPNDHQRIQRALEVYELTGIPLSRQQDGDGEQKLPYSLIKLSPAPEARSILHQRIATRFHQMLAAGFEQEVQTLLEKYDLTPALPSMRTVGYRQMLSYLSGEWNRETLIQKAIIATRQLAKRQLTWLRADPEIHTVDGASDNLMSQVLKTIESVSR